MDIYTDGACSGNPGRGGFSAVVVKDGKAINVVTGSDTDTTNNRMELNGFIAGLELAAAEKKKTSIHVDSRYVTDGITNWVNGWRKNGWKTSSGSPVKNQDLWEKADALYRPNKSRIKVIKVKGHSGDLGNELADQYAVRAITEKNT